MAKKIQKASRKPKLTRSSSIEKTIDEGKDYVSRADRRLRIRRAQPAPAARKENKIAKKPAPKRTKKSKRVSRPALPAVPAVPIPAVVAPVVRSGSKNISRSGSKNNQIIIEQ